MPECGGMRPKGKINGAAIPDGTRRPHLHDPVRAFGKDNSLQTLQATKPTRTLYRLCQDGCLNKIRVKVALYGQVACVRDQLPSDALPLNAENLSKSALRGPRPTNEGEGEQ